MYQTPQKPPQGTWPVFLDRMQRARNWSKDETFEALRDVMGWGRKSRNSYMVLTQPWHTPGPDTRRRLVEFFGEEPEDDGISLPAAPRETEDRLLVVVKALEAELLLWRSARARFDGLEGAVGELYLRLPLEPEPPGSTGRESPAETEESLPRNEPPTNG